MSLQPLSPPQVADPYPRYAQLREDAPVTYDDELGVWVVSRHEHVRAVLRDPATFLSALTLAPLFPICPAAGQVLSGLTADPVTVAGDPPLHPRTRKAMLDTFPTTPKKVRVYEPLVRARVDQLVDRMRERADAGEPIDLVRDFTWELPILVILTLLGVPESDFGQIKSWSDGQIELLWGNADEASQERLATDLVGFWNYCQELVRQHVARPQDDYTGALLRYRDGDDAVLTEREIASIVFNFLVAGHETTSNLLSNGLLHLLRDRASWERVAADRSLLPAVVEEMLRYDAPIMAWVRATSRDAELGGVTIPAGQRVLLLLGAANRDPRRFVDPERFDVDRADAKENLSFGLGTHFCVGAALSRMEAEVALTALLDAFPTLRLPDDFTPSYVANVAFRSLRALPALPGD